MTNFTFKRSATALMAAAFLSPVAVMAQTVGGGGATLPANAYTGTTAASPGDPRLATATAGSLFFQALPSATVTYCQTGSGTGRNVISGAGGFTNASLPCPPTFADVSSAGLTGFTAPRVDADFAGTDEPAGGSVFTAFRSNKASKTQLVQFPSIAGFISVIGNPPGPNAANIFLTEAELCNVWAGRITNWNQLATAGGAGFLSLPIKLVYRSDSSGTSFSFSNHLNKVCQDPALFAGQVLAPGALVAPFSNTTVPATNFTVNGVFASAFPTGVVPAGAIPAQGNPGVVGTVDTTNGAIGYAEAATAIQAGSTTFRGARIAPRETNGDLNPAAPATPRNVSLYRDPAANSAGFTIPTSFVDVDGVTYSGTYTGRSLASTNATFGRPVGAGIELTASQAPFPNCVFLVNPGAYATSVYRTAGNPDSAYRFYPITAITYLLGNYSGNFSASTMEALFYAPFNQALYPSITTIGANKGYAYLTQITATAVGGGASTLSQGRINACIN